MSDVNTKMCDNPRCKKLRMNDANHWFHGHLLMGGGFILLPFEVTIVVGVSSSSKTQTTSGGLTIDNASAHLCGQECAVWWAQTQISKLFPRKESSEQEA